MKKWLVALVILYVPFAAVSQGIPKPKLIIQLTIDQFSGNQLKRFKQHLTKEGFAYLIEHGVSYDNAHQYHATTETAVGHTTLATGAVPAVHGIIANTWWDRTQSKEIYALSDPMFGKSPKNILVPSFSDALGIATHNHSKRFAVSTKDRGAIPLAGQMGKAFWFDKHTGHYQASLYYYETLPKWALKWNNQNKAINYRGKQWALKKPCADYQFCKDHQQHLRPTLAKFGKEFPHPFIKNTSDSFFDLLTKSPVSDKLTFSFAKALVQGEALGHHADTDYLSISLSATDAIGHTFGPYSLESEDNFVRLNTELAHFLRFIDSHIGLKNTFIVLSADHGAGPSSSYLKQFHYPTVEINEADIKNNLAVKSVLNQHGLRWEKLIINESPDLYLNEQYVKDKKLQQQEFIRELANAIQKVPGIYVAVPNYRVFDNQWQAPYLSALLSNELNRQRSGDIYLIAKPHSYFVDTPGLKASHGSPWQYDTHVPLIFVSNYLEPQTVHQHVRTIEVAPTLAAILDIDPPSGSMGEPLWEVVGQ